MFKWYVTDIAMNNPRIVSHYNMVVSIMDVCHISVTIAAGSIG